MFKLTYKRGIYMDIKNLNEELGQILQNISERTSYTIYVYDENTGELNDTLNTESRDALFNMLYNLSGFDNGYIISLLPLENITDEDRKNNKDFKFHCKHIFENNGNFLKNYAV